MKIEIKRLTVNHRLSEETLNFACDIWVDGKKVGEAKNHGTGGPTDVYFDRNWSRAGGIAPGRDDDMRDRVRQYALSYLATRADVVRYEADSPCVLEGRAKVGDPVGDPVEYLIDILVHDEDVRRTEEKERKRIAKADAEMTRENEARGMGTLRWTRVSPRQTETRWCGIPKGKTPEEVAAYLTGKYAKSAPASEITWEVLS
jgi:hypothetical protein